MTATNGAPMRYVKTSALKAALQGHETDIIDALGIPWRAGKPHIRCPYPDHPDEHASWRWDEEGAWAFCTCGSCDVLDVLKKVERLDFDAAKVRAAEILGRTDLIGTRKTRTRKRQRNDAASLLDGTEAVRGGIDGAVPDEAGETKPQLRIDVADLPATARRLRDRLSTSGRLFERGVPVRVAMRPDGGPPVVKEATVNTIVVEAHQVCQPLKPKDGKWVPTTLYDRVARMYLDMVSDWGLPPLTGITTAPLLGADGSIRTVDGYDAQTGLWCTNVPDVAPMVPMIPMRDEAEAALRLIRQTFKTFPFADARRIRDAALGVDVVDQEMPPGADESAFLVGLMTAVCRPSLSLAPGLLVHAAAISGAGAGKGLLVRAVSAIAFGIRPRAFTTGGDRQEFEKRLAADLVEASPVVFIDNANDMLLHSNALASAMTERPARVRILGETRMVELNSTAFIAVTGNAITLSGDLLRRYLSCALDAQCEDPEARPFKPGFLEQVERCRAELLAAALTVWRWGRQNAASLSRGKPLGSFEQWAEWCRDPLLTLGGCDSVERIAEAKARDPRRQRVSELFIAWWAKHKAAPMKAAELADAVRDLIDPQERGRQFVAAELGKLVGTRAAGFVMTGQKGSGQWSAWTYALSNTGAVDGIGHRDHREHREVGAADEVPMTPMPPMPCPATDTEPTNRPDGAEPPLPHSADDEEFAEWTA